MTTRDAVDTYLANLPADRRDAMQQIRSAALSAAPGATEVITYGMPGLKTHGRFLVSYDAFKAHYSLFPASDAVAETLGAEIQPFLSGRGTIRFPADQPLPVDLVARIVAIRVTENDAAAAANPRAASADRQGTALDRRGRGG